MSQTSDTMELREEDIAAHVVVAQALLEGFDHTPRIGVAVGAAPVERSSGIGTRRRFRSTTPGLVTQRRVASGAVSLIARVEGADGDDALMSPLQSTVLHGLRRAIAIALAVAGNVAEQSGLGDLKRANLEGALPAARKAEFGELLAAEALVTLYVFGNATAYLMSAHLPEVSVDVGEVEEVLLDNGQTALHGVLWELDQDIAVSGKDDAHVVATVAGFAESLMEKVALRAQNMPQLEGFRSTSWRVAADDFTVSGFTPAHKAKSTTLTMTFKKPNEVVGNHIAKYQAMKLAKMLMAYDFDRRMNPFAEMGGFIFTFMGDGAPGTGKTTLIQMMAGLISEYCSNAGYPFRYQNLSTDNIDSYQGKSGQNAKAFINNIIDPSVIGFGTIDDIDQLAGKRGDRQSSAGQLEITAVLMESFAGANTVVRGNCTFGMFSNYPENVDDALRQRAGARFLVDGPQTREDYVDILFLLMGKNHDIPLGDHQVFEAQMIKKAVAASFEGHSKPHEAGLLTVYEAVRGEIGELDTINKLGTYLKAIQEADPRFTGRAIKNITDAVKVRAMDFELPDEWMEEPELFLFKGYDEKKAMIEEMRQEITVEMVVQEINRYADSEFRYADKSDEVAIDNAVRDMQRMEAAKKRYLSGGEG
ncbi:AAA family ATPase [Sulfitobacter sp. M57]|uniref:ATP-binding protein n=1 Tax=unclassified Sulfitobacter TaxID=196795 RepID=UPI0023E15F9D|nr:MULTISPECIES: ATP-binding protein [unclassified Sulfitobacter]MDF3414726.1 AAA family ATPase [Sulfitobacter sp. KE5]MDF3422207.1 AAA family ATPase [Sulfitobacter sp. KE43]MDF3433272.1 AAA family ATPase [Sulfitobacter sp. KE42]MDF3458912.1 AAA family ATPase [Sulfitobacter sp. S74]MDF3462811.1 AAA family ATPase [Sulfitobacter sp. Ks18]